MSNSFFKFKEFTIHQDQCAMKVCTDSCLFGAWISKAFSSFLTSEKKMLDIGTGTGLLSLMMAQKNEGQFDALEIELDAAIQARENLSSSPWSQRIQIIQKSLQEFKPSFKYDVIISNPPFFEGDLKSEAGNKNNAKHDTALTLDYLILFISSNLKPGGKASVIIPYHRTKYFEKQLHQSFFIEQKVLVRQTPRHDFFRAMYIFSNKVQQQMVLEKQISIRNQDGEYDAVFIELLKDYYLNF